MQPILMHVTTVSMTLPFLRGHIDHLLGRGYQVWVVSAPGSELTELAEISGVNTRAIPMQRQISPFADIVASYRLARLFRSVRPTIVHAHTPKAGLLCMLCAAAVGVPIRILHLHGLPQVTARGLRKAILHFTTRLSCTLSSRVLAVSEATREAVVADGLCPAEKIVVPANGSICGVDSRRFDRDSVRGESAELRKRFGIAETDFVFGFGGRLARDKGIAELAKAWAQLKGTRPNLHLLIAGELENNDPPPPHVIDELKADKTVHFLGWTRAMPVFLGTINVLVLPSYREGLAVSLLEAAAACVPAVATDIPGCREVVQHGTTGQLVPRGDASALAEALKVYAADPALVIQHGEAARQRVLKVFSPIGVFTAVEGEYEALLTSYQKNNKRKLATS